MSKEQPHEESATTSALLTGDVRPVVLRLALPVLCEQMLSFCVGLYDTWLSGGISADATSAIGLAAYVGWLASMLFGLVGVGTTALVARSVGGGNFDEARIILNRSLCMAAILGVVTGALLWLIAPYLADLLGMTGDAHVIVVRYLRIDSASHLFSSMTLVSAAALRGSGDMRTPMIVLGLVSLLNIVLSSIFVFGAGILEPMGVDGIVTGTLLSRATGGIVILSVLARGVGELRLLPSEMPLRGPIVRRILRVGIPAAADGMVMWGGQFMFLIVISRLGDGGFESAYFAAHVVGIQIEAVTYLPAVAWGHAASALIGQSLGAGLPDRAARCGHEAVFQCSVLGAILGLTFFFGAGAIFQLMHDDPAVHQAGIPAFRLMSFFQVPLVIAIVYTAALRGAGDTRAPLRYTCISVLFVRVPVAYLFGIVLEGGLVGAWIGMCSDVALRGMLVAIRFHRGAWARVEV